MSISNSERAKNTEEDYKIEMLPQDYPQHDLAFKLIIIGDSGVGKSCLTTKVVRNFFEEYHQEIIGFEFFYFNIKINGKVIKLQIWDLSGLEMYKSLISNFYQNSSLVVVIYSIDNKESLNHAENWLNDLKSKENPDVRIFLVGNKADLEEDRKVLKEEGEKYKKEKHLDLFLETSAKTGHNAINVFVEAAKILYKDYLKYEKNKNGDDKFKTEKENEKIKELIKRINLLETELNKIKKYNEELILQNNELKKQNKEKNNLIIEENRKIKELNEKVIKISNVKNINLSYDKIITLMEKLENKENEIKELKSKLPFELFEKENLLTVIFNSADQKIHYSLICKNTDVFNRVENSLYNIYPEIKNQKIISLLMELRLINVKL